MVNIKTKKKPNLAVLILKALFPRLLFLGHGLLCIWMVFKHEQDSRLWYLLICLLLLVFEGLFNAIVRKGKEFHWFCPSAFLYCIVLIATIIFFREKQIQCIVNSICITDDNDPLIGDDVFTRMFRKLSFPKRIIVIEQTGLLTLIIGRWLLPSGSISREQFSQILLIYIAMAADIVEFNEIYSNDTAIQDIKHIGGTSKLLHGVMGVWALAVLQFSLTITLPEEGLKQEEKEEEVELQNMSYFRKIKSNHVVPMSYMHYKSMLREETLDASKIASQRKNPVLTQAAFRQKYKNALNTSTSFQTSSLTNDLHSLKVDNNEEIFLHDGLTFPLPITSEEKASALNTKNFVTQPNELKYLPKIDSPSIKTDFSYTYSPATISPQSNKLQDGLQTLNKTNSDSDIEDTSSRRISFKPSLSKKPLINQGQSDSDQGNSLDIGKSEVKKCCMKYLELIGTLLALCMQDGPFFIFRFVLVTRFQVVTEMMILLTIKNALNIIVQTYRLLNMYCTEPKQEELEDEHASHRLRNALQQNEEMSELSSKRQRAALALTALARMRTMAENKGSGVKQNLESEINEFQSHGQIA